MRVIVRLLKEIRYIKGLFLLAVTVFVLAIISGQLSPLLLQRVIDGPLTKLGKGLAFNQADFLRQLGFYLVLVTLGAGFSYVATRLLMHCANKIAELMRNRAYETMQRLPISYFDDKPAGKIATRIVNDTETLRTQFYGMLVHIFTNILRVAFVYGIIFFLNPILGAVLLILLPAFYGLQVIYKRLPDKPMKDFYDARSEVNTQVNEIMNGASLIQLYRQEEAVLAEFDQTATKMKDADNRIIWAMSIASWPLSEFVKNMLVTAILTIVGMQFLSGHSALSAGRLFVYLNYVINLFDLMGMLVRQLPNIHRSVETGQRVLDLLDQEVEADADANLEVKEGNVVFDHVEFAYE